MPKTHLDYLTEAIPDILKGKVIDIGAGKGAFLIECANKNVSASGIECNVDNISIALWRAKEVGVTIDIKQGVAESITFPDRSFDFANLCEVIEHVQDPKVTLKEAYRVLSTRGIAYVSVPNRFGWFDYHFHLAFVNWMPRRWSDYYISLFGEHKDYSGRSGLQTLREMHYYTYNGFFCEAYQAGFAAQDMREIKIKNIFKNNMFLYFLANTTYKLLRPWYFETFHFKLSKK